MLKFSHPFQNRNIFQGQAQENQNVLQQPMIGVGGKSSTTTTTTTPTSAIRHENLREAGDVKPEKSSTSSKISKPIPKGDKISSLKYFKLISIY